jgi:hypothetical protein
LTKRAALGFRAHTGWAALVAAAGPPSSPTVVQRERVEIMPGKDANGPRFVYHAAAKLALPAAERLVRDARAEAGAKAKQAVRAAVDALEADGFDVVGAGVIVGNRPLTSPLAAILAAHSLIHAAEGELFRRALVDACEACGLPVRCVRANELAERGAAALDVAADALGERLAALGRAAGRPWAQDQKDALLAALLAFKRVPPSRPSAARRDSRGGR